MKVAALLALLAALPAHAGDAVTPAQARSNVVQALPPDIARGAGTGDLRAYLERLNPEQKAAALRALEAKEGELGSDPATLGVMGQAYAGLGRVKEAKEAALELRRRDPNDPVAKILMDWVTTQEKIPARNTGGAALGEAGGPGGGGQSRAATRTGTHRLSGVEGDVQRAILYGQKGLDGKGSNEFKDVLEDAKGYSIEELRAAGIHFRQAKPDQRDAVLIEKTTDGTVAISILPGAIVSGENKDARAAAHVANGVRQAQTYRDHNFVVAWTLVKARGWISAARTHRDLAPNDIDSQPTTIPDKILMIQRKLLSAKEGALPRQPTSYGTHDTTAIVQMTTIMSKQKTLEEMFGYFLDSAARAGEI